MSKAVKPKDVAGQIMQMLDQYTEDVGQQIRAATKGVLKDARADVKTASPKRTGAYAKDWSTEMINGANFVQGRVYNRSHYRLTHLLEHGHVIRNGTGRTTYGQVDPSPKGGHIAGVNDKAQQALENAIKEAIENG